MATLSTYLDNITTPDTWSACHYPIIFQGNPKTRTNVIMDNNGGYMRITFNSAFPITLGVGELIYVGGGIYIGFHIIRTVDSSLQVTTETTYTTTDNLPQNIKYCSKLNFELWKGYEFGEQYYTQLPITKIADLTVEINTKTVSYSWDVSGFLKSIFQIKPPTIGVDFNLFNRFRFYFQDQELETYQVANAAFPQVQFNQLYVNTGRFLNAQEPIDFLCGATIKSVLQSNIVLNIEIDDAQQTPDFDPNDFNSNFDIT